MTKYDTNQYVRILDKLPKEIKDVVASSETVEHIWKIGQKHNLHIDKLGIMSDTTYDVMMGIVSTKDFVNELSKNLDVSILEASTLARDIDENVFKPIKQTMTALYANGAPNRPSSSLVKYYDEDEDHPSLNKDELLKGIEDPAPAEVKKEVSSLQVSAVSFQENTKDKIEPPTKNIIPQPKQLEIYHEELENESKIGDKPLSVSPLKKVEDRISKIPASLPVNNLAASDLLNKIAGIKLSKTFVMPKREGTELRGLGGEKLGSTDSKPKEVTNLGSLEENKSPTNLGVTNSNPIKSEAINKTETPKQASATIDPYREKI